MLSVTDLLSLFFELLKCKDKELRKFLKTHLVSDIKNMNAKHKDVKMNTTLQNFMYSMLQERNAVAAKMSLDIMTELYTKNIWRDAKTVNAIANCCFSKITKQSVAALKFFLGKDEDDMQDNKDSDSEDDDPVKSLKMAKMANRVNKKTGSRKKVLEKVKKAQKKNKSHDKQKSFDFSGLHLIYDPQGMAEKLLESVSKMTERFEVKLMFMNMISRLVGVHQLFLFNFYPLIQRYLTPHQKEVTKILVYTAQACHELVPPDVLEPVVRTIADNFISERNSGECIAVGINSIREICARCPLVMTQDLLQDLVEYQKYKDKNVSMAARSLIQFFRVTNPHLLRKKDRGKPTEASIEIKARMYGELDSRNYIPGAEVLLKTKKTVTKDVDKEHGDDEDDEEWEDDEDEGDDANDMNDGWESCSEDGDEGEESEWSNMEQEEEEQEDLSAQDLGHNIEEQVTKESDGKKIVAKTSQQMAQERLKERAEDAAEISSSRFLTDEEFKLMKRAQLKKQIEAAHPRNAKRKRTESDDQSDDDDDEELEDLTEKNEIVSLKDIERLYKKTKANKESRLATVMAGREGREKFGKKHQKMNPFASKKEKEKKKNKVFNMIKYKARSKSKKSFQEKQQELKHRLLKKLRNKK